MGKFVVKDFLDKYEFDYLIVDNSDIFLLRELESNVNYEKVLTVKKDTNNNYYLFVLK